MHDCPADRLPDFFEMMQCDGCFTRGVMAWGVERQRQSNARELPYNIHVTMKGTPKLGSTPKT
jgi:chitinase